MKQVKGYPNLYRNNTGAIINTDSAGNEKYLEAKQRLINNNERMKTLENEVKTLKKLINQVLENEPK